MKKKRVIELVVVSLFCAIGVMAQEVTYKSVIKDRKEQVVEFATVVLLDGDSLVLTVGASDSEGTFSLTGEGAKYLRISHLAYKDALLSLSEPLPEVIYLEESDLSLDELVVKADRPLMKLVDGSIPNYDIDVLFENSPITTAYEMLGRLPGMAMEGGVPTLMGTTGYTLVLNSKPSDIPQGQLLEMLKTIPVQMVANVEISYAPIARYRAKGASINVILKTQSKDKQLSGLSGQLFAGYYNTFYDTYSGGGNISYAGESGWAFNGGYKGSGGKSYTDMSFETEPFGGNSGIAVNNVGVSKFLAHTLFSDLSYSCDKHSVSLNYYGDINPRNRYIESDIKNISPLERNQESKTQTHHAALEYVYNNSLMVGGFYTRYNTDRELQYGMDKTPLEARAHHYIQSQSSEVWGAHIDNRHRWQSGWGLEYGSKLSYSHTVNRQDNFVPIKSENERISRELLADLYLGVKKQFSPRLNAGITLIGDYAKYFDHEDNFQLIPQANLTYVINPANIVQFNLQSQKSYPAYYEREPFEMIHSEYQMWKGNPELRPFVSYDAKLLYIHKQKYIFILEDTYNPDYFVQQMYLDPERNQIVYRTWNWDYYNTLSAVAVLPLPQMRWWEGKLTINGQLNSLQMDVPFAEKLRRNKIMLFASMTNDFRLSQKHNISLGLNGTYIKGGMQGYYDFADMFNLSASAKWTSQNQKWSVTLQANDLLNSAIPKVKADYGIHKFNFEPMNFNRSISLDIRYTFGGFKTIKKPTQLNTERFGM
ncbi:outer membrane beta-barrel protein [Porphyromonadaceae bacterium W3.11]|nr:outer membrane beta-barrel protein [Porphyromonadaceae bacterium W3.11]